MLKLNFLLVLRQLRKDKKSFLVNLIGSSIGFTSIVLMALYISYEGNYDSFNENHGKLFRIERTVNDKIEHQKFDTTPYELAKKVKVSFPEIVNASSVRTTKNYLSIDNEVYPREEGLIADNSFLKMFSFHFISGSQNNALVEPKSIVLSETLANKLFPEGEVIGKIIKVNKKSFVTVTGVFKDYPQDSHFSMEYIISYNSYKELFGIKHEKGWDTNYSCTYILLGNGVQVDKLSDKLKNLLDDHVTFEDGSTELLSIRPITDVYLNSLDVRNDAVGGVRNNVIVIYLFLIVVFFTAFVTTVNYINLTTTQLVNRELEIGMKKVLGISKNQLQFQFIIESLFMIFSIILLSSVLVVFILPFFSEVVGRDLSLSFKGSNWFFLKIVFISLVLGCIGGLYPVFYLASLKITSFLQGNTSIKRRSYLRKGLVLFQLFITIPLIFLSIYIISQIDYLNEKDLGFKKENLLMTWIKTPNEESTEHLKVIKNTLLQNPNILNYTISEGAPFFSSGGNKKMGWEGSVNNEKIRLSSYAVDYDFLETFKMNLVKGRWFSKEYSTDVTNSCIVNETTVLLMGLKDPIGKTIDNGRLKIIGVVKDFNQFSLFQKIPPIMFTMTAEDKAYAVVSIKINNNNRVETKREINEVFNSSFTNDPVEFRFLEDGFDKGYMSALENVMKIFILFSVISILLVVIGLYSLISFSLKTQKKMIAIRKILGASTKKLFTLILKEYVVLYVIATSLSLILTYFGVLQFSEIFPYSVGVTPLVFLNVILITFFIVLISISGKIWFASRENPINAINNE
ncbi:ABC transporter permease [Tenacibaculum halocynthiae]|uniref:ABC transporter permease n=1 Tax=Tenacibaculum halocynthiae TaxID=1254437 RepID=UPI003892E8F8